MQGVLCNTQLLLVLLHDFLSLFPSSTAGETSYIVVFYYNIKIIMVETIDHKSIGRGRGHILEQILA